MSSAEPEVDLLSSIERGEAPRRILEFAARGFVPLPPSELVRVIGTILASEDPELGPLAEETFRGFSAEDLKRSVLSDHVRPESSTSSRDGPPTRACWNRSSAITPSRTRR